MSVTDIPKYLFFLFFLLLLHLPNSQAVFVGKNSCGFENSDVLDLSSKMWIMSGPEFSDVSTSIGQKLYFPPHSLFKVISKKDNTTVIEAQHPHVMTYKLFNISQLKLQSGQLTVSCLNDRRRAEKELGVVKTSTDSSSSEFPSETEPSITPLPEDVTSTNVKHLSPRSLRFENSSTNGSSIGMQNSTVHNEESTTVRTTLSKETTKQVVILDNPVTTSTTRKTSVATKPTTVTTLFVVYETEEKTYATKKETSPHPVTSNIPTTPEVSLDKQTPNGARVTAIETFEVQSTTVISPSRESQSHSSISVEAEPSEASFNVEDHIPYFAACGVLLILTVLVAAIIFIVQRRRTRRRSFDNHEDLFITSTYDEMLLRNNESIDGRSSRVMMYGSDEPVVLDPRELEGRILGDNTFVSTNDDERPRCLGDE